tara:strand:- start:3810 stop:4157 length:348 start_codon:yes stop_codon:yes gene_type:complete
MFRRLVAVSMLVAFVAMSTSGLMMLVIEKPSFSIQMHPVHKTFGILMVLAAICHIYLNSARLKTHLKERSGQLTAALMTTILVVLYGVSMQNELPADLAATMDEAAAAAEVNGNE